jgi:MFS family permease
MAQADSRKGFSQFPLFRALRHRDFRILWIGSLLSFMGGQMQGVAQGYWVHEQTNSEGLLGMVSVCWSLPIMLLAPLAGVVTDRMDRRKALLICQIVLTIVASATAILLFFNQLQYWHIIAAALISGTVSTVEGPARQSVVRVTVGDEDLPAAVPAQAMTFNLSRILGPAIGGLILEVSGPFWCFAINAFSFAFLILSILMIRADLRPAQRELGDWRDLLMEGFHYTFRTPPLKVLFFMEAATSMFGVFYVALLPAIARDQLGLDKGGLGLAHSSIGIGAILALLALSALSDRPVKTLVTRLAMGGVAVGVLLLSITTQPAFAYPLLGLIGFCAISQFNSTNVLFQLLSPEPLRGRLIAMHFWAIAGVSPFGIFAFSWLADRTSNSVSLMAGGSILSLITIWAWTQRSKVKEPEIATGAA